jgi:hypothetical protein
LSNTKRQHYVPRFYLKNFAVPTSSLFCYDKSNDNVFKTSIDNAAFRKNFYEVGGLESRLIEGFLSRNESKFSNAFRELITEKNISNLSLEGKLYFFLFLALQGVRTLDYRLELQNVLDNVYHEVFSEFANNYLKKKGSRLAGHVRVRPDPQESKIMQLELIIKAVPTFAHILASRTWYLSENFNDVLLWTSDNPVVLHNEVNRGRYGGNLGLQSPGLEVHFPLTKDLHLLSFDIGTTQFKRSTMGMFTHMNVIFENDLQLENCSRFVYAPSNNDFYIAKRFLLTNPHCRNRKQRTKVYSREQRIFLIR